MCKQQCLQGGFLWQKNGLKGFVRATIIIVLSVPKKSNTTTENGNISIGQVVIHMDIRTANGTIQDVVEMRIQGMNHNSFHQIVSD